MYPLQDSLVCHGGKILHKFALCYIKFSHCVDICGIKDFSFFHFDVLKILTGHTYMSTPIWRKVSYQCAPYNAKQQCPCLLPMYLMKYFMKVV